ncbi:MAG: hypothetical protein CTY19_12980 [Methylomonas sp.]|nr:MAG: hypothetical protein CTY19_12980 [Methylomonas sp.]
MPSLARVISTHLFICLAFWPLFSAADSFVSQIRQANVIYTGSHFHIQTQIDYQLSPTAKEALHKGIPLTWRVRIQIRKIGKLWDSTLSEQSLPYRLRFHALLNQYEVLKPDKENEMFLTLNAALGFMSSLQDSNPVSADLLRSNQRYKLAIKCQFDRESLPVPLRPFAYLDSQWFLSSDWYLWPIQK